MRRSAKYLWISVFILLSLNLALLFGLNLVRLTTIEVLSKIETNLDNLANEVIVYNIEVNQAVPIKADVPFNQTMEIPINTVIPIDQTITLPFQTGSGEIEIDMPVKADFPIDMVVPVQFNEAISVDTVVQLNTTVPVEINIAQTPLAGYLTEAKLNVAQLRSRLTLQREATAMGETAVVTAPNDETNIGAGPTPTHALQSQVVTTEGESSSVSGASVSQPNSASTQLELGDCAHAYWPLRPGTMWTYNSSNTSYTQSVESVLDNQVYINTQYEGQPIQFDLECYHEGLGGSFLGDMRRITELGNLDFNNLRGTFLPRLEVIEKGAFWTQEYDVTGTVKAYQGNNSVVGIISRGRGVFTYTSNGFGTLETPLGPRDALRLEQKVELELEINFDLSNRTIPATETVNLTTVYWFVKGIGLVKMHWQGGNIQQDFEIDGTNLKQQYSIPALAEEHLVSVCVPTEEENPDCLQIAGISQSDLTVPPEVELTLPQFILPDVVTSDSDVRGDSGVSNEDSVSIEEIVQENELGKPALAEELLGEQPEFDDGELSPSLLAYIEAAAELGKRIAEAGEKFAESAIAYRNDELTLDEFRDEFSSFAPKVRQIIQEISNLLPPPEAEPIHQKLTSGLNQCDKAVGLMDEWFDSRDSDTKEVAALLVASCINQVNEAGDELKALINEN